MRYLTKDDVLELHAEILAHTGGLHGVHDDGALESALAQPSMTFDGHDLYSTLSEKAATLGFSLINNHPFLDGNKRIGHAVMEVFLILNGYELDASIDEQEQVILRVAAGELSRDIFAAWVKAHLKPFQHF